jgi:hypothetical protein
MQFVQCLNIWEDGCGWKTVRESKIDVLAYLEHFRVRNETAIIDPIQDTCSSDPHLNTIRLEQNNTVLLLPPASRIKVSHGLTTCLTSAILVNIQDVPKSLECRDNMSDIENTVVDDLRAFHGADNEGSDTMYSHRFLKHLMLLSS